MNQGSSIAIVRESAYGASPSAKALRQRSANRSDCGRSALAAGGRLMLGRWNSVLITRTPVRIGSPCPPADRCNTVAASARGGDFPDPVGKLVEMAADLLQRKRQVEIPLGGLFWNPADNPPAAQRPESWRRTPPASCTPGAISEAATRSPRLRVPVERDRGFRSKLIT